VRDDRPVERADSLALPAELAALIAQVHGTGAEQEFEVPADYGDFVRTHGGGLWTVDKDGAPDPYGWDVARFSGALAATTGLYQRTVQLLADGDWTGEASVRSLREVGIWLRIGRYGWRHDHFLCCDRSRAEFGQVYDCNDGGPAHGLVPDGIWASFREYLIWA
jgi:hypothetical protein